MANPMLVLFANPKDRSRITAALSATSQTLAQGGLGPADPVLWNIDVVYTYNSNIVATEPVLTLPFNKMQMAEPLPPTSFDIPLDPLTLNKGTAVWSIYGGTVADIAQTRKLELHV